MKRMGLRFKSYLIVCILMGTLNPSDYLWSQVDLQTMVNKSTLPKELEVKYPIHSGAGNYLISVKSYLDAPELKGQVNAKKQAEELVEFIRNEYRLPAYIYIRGMEEKLKQQKWIEDKKRKFLEFQKKFGNQDSVVFRYKVEPVSLEYGVLIGGPEAGWKEDVPARKVLNELRKSKNLPPQHLLDTFVYIPQNNLPTPTTNSKNKNQLGTAAVNPFVTSFVAWNPTIPRPKQEMNERDPALKHFNQGEEYSLLKCRKKWTIVVRVYNTFAVVTDMEGKGGGNSILGDLFGTRSARATDASGMAAHEMAKLLRSLNPPFEAYVIHMRNCSVVTVGGFNQDNDPKLLELQKTLSNLKFTDQKSGTEMESLLTKPVIMKIPRP